MTARGTRDRIALALVGALAVVVGGYALARNLGALGATESDEMVLGDQVRQTLVEQAGWAAGIATFLALALAWAGWRWLRRLLVGTSSSAPRQVVVVSGADGRTAVEARAVAEAVERDLGSISHVTAARARVVGAERVPALDLAVDLASTADADAVRRQVEDYVLPRARAALERDHLAATVRLRLGHSSSRALQ